MEDIPEDEINNPQVQPTANGNEVKNCVEKIDINMDLIEDKEKILEDYSKSVKNHQLNDKYLLKWIKAALEKL